MTSRTETLAGFAALMGIPVPPVDEKGMSSLFVGEDVPVFLQLDDEGTEALLFAGLGALPRGAEDASCRALLQANHFWGQTGGFTLALMPNTSNVMLIGRDRLGDEPGPALHDLFGRFASAADLWHKQLPTVAEDQARGAAALEEAASEPAEA